MTGLSLIIALAISIEKFTEIIKGFVSATPNLPDQLKPTIVQIITSVIGIVVAIGAGLDVFKEAGINFSIPYVGMIAMGLVLGRGSNYAHDFFTNLKPSVGESLLAPIQISTEAIEDIPSKNAVVASRSDKAVG